MRKKCREQTRERREVPPEKKRVQERDAGGEKETINFIYFNKNRLKKPL